MKSSLSRRRSMRELAFAAIVVAALASCGGDDAAPLPPVVGKRVVYTANTQTRSQAMELWVTDTAGSATTPSRVYSHLLGSSSRIDQPFVSPGGAYFGGRDAIESGGTVSSFGVIGCPASLRIFTVATGAVNSGYPVSGNACLHELKFNPAGGALAMRFSFAGANGANLATTTTSDFPNTIFTVDTNSHVQTGGTVQRFRWSIDGNVPTWTETSGLYSASGSGFGAATILRSSDVPVDYQVGQIANIPYAVYVAPGETRFRITNLTPFAAQSQTYLTNALAGGDALGAWSLSPDGAHLLYEVRISGVWQLWLVSLAAPLAEQRVDAAAPLIASSIGTSANAYKTVFGFNPDNTRFVWSGDVGGGSVRLNTATVAAPTVATVLTPATESPYEWLIWSDANTVVYGEWDFGLPGPLHPVSMRTVSISAPLVTVPLFSASVSESDNYVFDVDMCSDGTIVYATSNTVFTTNGDSWTFNGLFAVHPNAPGDLRRITPWYGNFNDGVFGISDFDCE